MTAIEDGITGDPSAYEEATGRQVPSLEETLRMLPSTVQERWFSSLYLVMPALLGVLAIFWIASGLIGLARLDAAASVLSDEPGVMAKAAVVVASLVDVALGVGILFRPAARLACVGMIATSTAYLVGGTVFTPGLWLDPLGPFLKVLPSIVAAWIAWVMIGTR